MWLVRETFRFQYDVCTLIYLFCFSDCFFFEQSSTGFSKTRNAMLIQHSTHNIGRRMT